MRLRRRSGIRKREMEMMLSGAEGRWVMSDSSIDGRGEGGREEWASKGGEKERRGGRGRRGAWHSRRRGSRAASREAIKMKALNSTQRC